MKTHVLPGDSLVGSFEKTGVEGEVVVCRECLVDGDVEAANLDEFWTVRANFLSLAYGGEKVEYQTKVVDGMNRLINLAEGGEVFLWFEYELFCQVNFWFCVSLLNDKGAKLRVVYPKIQSDEDLWKGFGFLDNAGLVESLDSARELSPEDVDLAAELWKAFQVRDSERLTQLGETDSVCFPTLKQVCEAAAEIRTRPRNTIKGIIADGKTEFGEVFKEFSKIEGVYGFGDLQVKRLFDHVRAGN